ncbi:MAG: hypothetical protein WD025_06405 [Bacteriovoracaceae bacterium]
MEMSLSIKTNDFFLGVEIDSSDTLYKVQFAADQNPYKDAGSALKSGVLNQKISQILNLSAGDLTRERPTLPLERCLFAVKQLIKNFQGDDLYKSDLSPARLSSLVCRCLFLDKQALERSFMEAKGDFKKAVLSTQASLICSTCSKDVKLVYENMSFKEVSEQREKVRKAAQKALDEFSLFSPPEFQGMSFEVASSKTDTVKIKALNRNEGLGRLKIQKTLENYLRQEIAQGLRISVFF